MNVQNEAKRPGQDDAAAEPVQELEAVEAQDVKETEDPLQICQEALAQAQAQAEEYLDGWQRARAEFANYRRREETRREQSATEITARVLSHFLPVLDDLERAFSSAPPELKEHPWLHGLTLVGQKMLNGMEKEGVAAIPTAPGDPFDPNLHMAVLHVPCADYDEGQVAMVLQRGYTIGDRVLRPAMVQVSSGRQCDEVEAGKDGDSTTPAEGPATDSTGPTKETND